MRGLCRERIEHAESEMSASPRARDLPTIDAVLGDPSASFWLKTALCSALYRDPSMLLTTPGFGRTARTEMRRDP